MEVMQPIAPTKMAKFVQIQDDGSEFICDLPIAHNFNDGTGALFYVNKGYVPYDQYMAEKNDKAAKAKREKGEK